MRSLLGPNGSNMLWLRKMTEIVFNNARATLEKEYQKITSNTTMMNIGELDLPTMKQRLTEKKIANETKIREKAERKVEQQSANHQRNKEKLTKLVEAVKREFKKEVTAFQKVFFIVI